MRMIFRKESRQYIADNIFKVNLGPPFTALASEKGEFIAINRTISCAYFIMVDDYYNNKLMRFSKSVGQ